MKVKVYFKRADLEGVSDQWTYTLTSAIDGFADITGGKADFTEEGEFFVLTLPAVGASDFHVPFVLTVPGADPMEISVMSLCERGISATYEGKTAELVSLLKSIYNFGLAAHERFHSDSFDGVYQSNAYSGKYQGVFVDTSCMTSADGSLAFTGARLSWGNATGIDLYIKAESDVTVTLFGKKLSERYYTMEEIEESQRALFGGATKIIRLFVRAETFETPFTIAILANGQSAELSNVTVAAIANINPDPAERNLIQRFLAYVEAVDRYINPMNLLPLTSIGNATDFTAFGS